MALLPDTFIWPGMSQNCRVRARPERIVCRRHSGHLQRPLRDAIDLPETTSWFTAWRRNPWLSLPSTRTTGVTCSSTAEMQRRRATTLRQPPPRRYAIPSALPLDLFYMAMIRSTHRIGTVEPQPSDLDLATQIHCSRAKLKPWPEPSPDSSPV